MKGDTLMRTEVFELGDDVFCEGTTCGRLTAVAVRPTDASLAYLIVEPGPSGEPRLVPAARAHVARNGISLDCTQQQFEDLEPALIAHLEPAEAATSTPTPMPGRRLRVEFEDRVPADEVRIHENTGIHAADGDVGRVAGVTVDPSDNRVTRILVDESHLWGYKRVAIPMRTVRSLDDGRIAVRLSKRQIKGLPPIGE